MDHINRYNRSDRLYFHRMNLELKVKKRIEQPNRSIDECSSNDFALYNDNFPYNQLLDSDMFKIIKLFMLIAIFIIIMPDTMEGLSDRSEVCKRNCRKFWKCMLNDGSDCEPLRGECECKAVPAK
uniref:Late nodulin n=1 Tax=Onchocerca volvulus TaxID=6282 RepID=A0A8R1Y6I2_ONCVO